ncbi:alpha/beta fold hydrolase [Croceitalea marina]|uniref:Alpha/beta fold hydrolase n=1 Tax=Croceitalea marina TaxID=1775166 RepID=A0ABW5MZH3_9FLAO
MKLIQKIFKIVFVGLIVLTLIVVALYGHSDMPLEDLKEKYAQSSSSFVSVDGMNVHFRDEGSINDTIPLVLLHGTGASLHTFNDWAYKLKQGYRVIRMDLPAYGLTGPFPNGDYSIDNYVHFIKNFLTALGIEKCVLGGNSLGGNIAWNFATQHPAMVHKLILIDASGYPTKPTSEPLAFKIPRMPVLKHAFKYITPYSVVKTSVENVYADKSKVTEELVTRYFELTLREGNRQAFIDRIKSKNDTTAYRKIKYIKHPSLVLWGAEDYLIPIENALRFHEDLPNDTLVILKNVGHVPMEESPSESLAVVIYFLERN